MASSSGNSLTDAKRMILTFRVLELKEFLKSVNVSSGGRKNDLQDRAMSVVESGNPKILQTLQQLYQRRFPGSQQPGVKIPPKPPVSHSTANPPSFHVKHPDVKFKNHPFYQNIDSVHRTTAMESSSYMKKAMTIQFHLTPQHIRQIFDSESIPGNYRTQVVLRFCKKETTCDQDDFYPGNCYITINNQSCPIPGYNPNFSMRPEYKRIGKPINITTYIHTSAAIVNTLCVTWNRDIVHSQGFCFSIDLMTCLSPTDLLHKLRAKGTRSSDVSKAMIRDKLLMDRDSEISTTSLKISLICPLGKTKISNPCKSTSCDHLQCFDASIYLQMNERKAKWICPVCDRPAPFTDLLIDGYLLEICERTTDALIEFDTNGSWHPIKKNKDKIVTLTPPTTSITIADSPRTVNNLIQDSTIIDLTADSSEEDDIPELPLDIPIDNFRPITSSTSNALSKSIDCSNTVDPHSNTVDTPHSDIVDPEPDTVDPHSDTTKGSSHSSNILLQPPDKLHKTVTPLSFLPSSLFDFQSSILKNRFHYFMNNVATTESHTDTTRAEAHSNTTSTGSHSNAIGTEFRFNTSSTESNSRPEPRFNTDAYRLIPSSFNQPACDSSSHSQPTRIPVISKHSNQFHRISSQRKTTPTQSFLPLTCQSLAMHTSKNYNRRHRHKPMPHRHKRYITRDDTTDSSDSDSTPNSSSQQSGRRHRMNSRKTRYSDSTDSSDELCGRQSKRKRGPPSHIGGRYGYRFSPESNTSSQPAVSSRESTP